MLTISYNHSCRMVEKVGSSVSMPRIATRQQHQSNISSADSVPAVGNQS